LSLEVGNSSFPVGTFNWNVPASCYNWKLRETAATLTSESNMAAQIVNRSETVVIYCLLATQWWHLYFAYALGGNYLNKEYCDMFVPGKKKTQL